MKTLLLALILGFTGVAHALTVCDEIERRLGDEGVFQNFLPNAAVHPTVAIRKTADGRYATASTERSGSFALSDYGMFCILTAEENSYFPREKYWSLSVPNARGECWVAMARISKLVPADQEPAFIRGGFCVSPVEFDPETAWLGTSAMTPAAPGTTTR